jgi:hypothetical protein
MKGYKMPGNLASVRKPPCNRTLGIEIECLVKEMNGREYTHQGFFYLDNDASIERQGDWRSEPCEFVSQPLTLSWMHRELSKLNKKFEWEVNDSCGIHVHVSRKWLGTTKAKRIYEWIQAQDREDIKELFGRSPNDYCLTTREWASTRYLAINNENEHTIEFRGFASGAEAWPHWCVDFVTYLINHAYHLNIEAVVAFYQWWWDNESKKYIVPARVEASPLVEAFIEGSSSEYAVSAVRRVRRAAPSTLGELLNAHINR